MDKPTDKPEISWQQASWAVHIAGINASSKSQSQPSAVEALAKYTAGHYAGPASGDYQALSDWTRVVEAAGDEVTEIELLYVMSFNLAAYDLAAKARLEKKIAELRGDDAATIALRAYEAREMLRKAAVKAFADMPAVLLTEAVRIVTGEMALLSGPGPENATASQDAEPGK